MFILIELIIMDKGNNICKAQCLGHNKCSVSFPSFSPLYMIPFHFFFLIEMLNFLNTKTTLIFLMLASKGSYRNDIK